MEAQIGSQDAPVWANGAHVTHIVPVAGTKDAARVFFISGQSIDVPHPAPVVVRLLWGQGLREAPDQSG